MGLFGPSNQDILNMCTDTNQRVRAIQGTVDRTYVAVLSIENCLRDIDSNIRVGNSKLGDIMSHQERANQIAQSLSEDAETIARFGDFFAVAVANYEVAMADLQAQLAAAKADAVDLTAVEAAAGDLSRLADVFEAILDPGTTTPAPEDVPVVEPVEETPADVTAEDTSEAPADAATPETGGEVVDDAGTAEAPVDEGVAPSATSDTGSAAQEDAPAVTDPEPTESSTDDGTSQS